VHFSRFLLLTLTGRVADATVAQEHHQHPFHLRTFSHQEYVVVGAVIFFVDSWAAGSAASLSFPLLGKLYLRSNEIYRVSLLLAIVEGMVVGSAELRILSGSVLIK